MEEIIKSLINIENTFIGEAPIDIDNCQWIASQPSMSEIHFDKSTYDRLEYKVYVRNVSNEVAKNMIYDIYKRLQGYIGANYVIIVDRLPYYINRDVKYRSVYALKIEIQLGGY